MQNDGISEGYEEKKRADGEQRIGTDSHAIAHP